MIIIRNNIEYRKESSLAIAKFKQHENFILTQVTEGKRTFDMTSKELMLLNFRIWSRWLTDMEDDIAFMSSPSLTEDDLKHVLYTMQGAAKKCTIGILENTHLFERKKSECWLEVHKKMACPFFEENLRNIVGMSKTDAFRLIVDNLIEMMLMAMYELWEIKLVEKDDSPNKLAYTNLSYEFHKTKNECRLCERALIYKKFYGATDFEVENYSNYEPIIHPKELEFFKENGLNISGYKLSGDDQKLKENVA